MSRKEPVLEICPDCGAEFDTRPYLPLSRVICPQCGSEVVIGRRIDTFELINVLDEGDQGVVYRAKDVHLGRDIALKLLRPSVADTQLVKTFSSEAAGMGRLHHPNIIRILSNGRNSGRYYTTMELPESGSLRERVNHSGPLSENEALTMAIQIAEGLDAAWQEGMIHAGVTPRNIVFSEAQVAMIANFWVTISEDDAAHFAAPEVITGQGDDLLSDIYSLGASLYFALTSRSPFSAATTTDTLLALKRQPVRFELGGGSLSGETMSTLRKMMHHDAAQRFQSYAELTAQLRRCQQHASAPQRSHRNVAVPLRVGIATEAKSGSSLKWAWIISSLVLVIAIGGFAYFLRDRFIPPEPPPVVSHTEPPKQILDAPEKKEKQSVAAESKGKKSTVPTARVAPIARVVPATPAPKLKLPDEPKLRRLKDRDFAANAVPLEERAEIAPGLYRLVNFVTKKYLAIDPDDPSRWISDEASGTRNQNWEIAPANPESPRSYTIRSQVTQKFIDVSVVRWGENTVLEIATDHKPLATHWIFAVTKNEGFYRLVSETGVGALASTGDSASRNKGIEMRVQAFPVSDWRLEPVDPKDSR